MTDAEMSKRFWFKWSPVCDSFDDINQGFAAWYQVTPGPTRPITYHGYTFKDLYRIDTTIGDSFLVKIRPSSAIHVRRSVDILFAVNDPSSLLEKYKAVLEVRDDILLITKWIDGVTARDRRDTLVPCVTHPIM